MDASYVTNSDEERQEHMRVDEGPHLRKVGEVLYGGVLWCPLITDSKWKLHTGSMSRIRNQYPVQDEGYVPAGVKMLQKTVFAD